MDIDTWKVAEAILGLVARHLRDSAHDVPHSIDLIEGASSKTCDEVLHLLTVFWEPADHGQAMCMGRRE